MSINSILDGRWLPDQFGLSLIGDDGSVEIANEGAADRRRQSGPEWRRLPNDPRAMCWLPGDELEWEVMSSSGEPSGVGAKSS